MQEGQPLKIDIGKEFLEIFQKFLLHILFGSDIDSCTKVVIQMRPKSGHDYYAKECTLSEAVEETFE